VKRRHMAAEMSIALEAAASTEMFASHARPQMQRGVCGEGRHGHTRATDRLGFGKAQSYRPGTITLPAKVDELLQGCGAHVRVSLEIVPSLQVARS
jgi:hypothetical protein